MIVALTAVFFFSIRALAQTCTTSSATDSTFGGDLCPDNRPLAGGLCRKADSYGLQCKDLATVRRSGNLSPQREGNSETIEICGDIGTQVECPQGRIGGIRLVSESFLCLRCLPPEPDTLPVLIDSCSWQTGPTCSEDSVLLGVCGGLCAFHAKCCFVQPEGCASPATWTKSTSMDPNCPQSTAVAAACGYGCSSCIAQVSGSTSGMFCRPSVYVDSTVESVCAPFAQCPGSSVLVGYRPCSIGVRTTEARCSELKAGSLKHETCISVSGDEEVWCPEGYLATGICAPPFTASCDGGATTLMTCCRVTFTTSAIPCTLGTGIFAVAGNSEIQKTCPELGFTKLSTREDVIAPQRSSQGLLGVVFSDGSGDSFEIKDIAFSHDRNLLFALIGNRLVQLPVNHEGPVAAELQAVELAGPTALTPLNKEQILVSEGSLGSAAIKSLTVAASGRRWFVGYVAGASQEVAGGVTHGASATSPISQVETIAFNPDTLEIFFSSNAQIYRVVGPRVYSYAGGVESAMNVDGVDKAETGFIAPVKLVPSPSYFFIADAAANAVRYIDRRSVVRNLFGRYSFNASETVNLDQVDSCSSGASMSQIQLGKVAGMALFEEKQVLFVTDTIGRCIRRIAVDPESSLSVCTDLQPYTCGQPNALPQPQHAPSRPFLPQHLSLSSSVLYMTSNSSGTIYATLLLETVDVNTTGTRSLRISESISTSRASMTLSLSEPSSSLSTSFPTISDTVTVSQSTCEELKPEGVFISQTTGEILSEVSATTIEETGMNFTVKLLSCHAFRILSSSNNETEDSIVRPAILYNETVHPDGYKTSIYGFNRVREVMDYFVTMFPPGSSPGRSGSEYVVMRLNPYRKYHPTLDETVVFEWPSTALQFSNEPLRVPLKVVATQKYVYHPQLMNFVYFATTISLFSSFLTASPAPALRAGRLEFMSRTSVCPIEDSDDPLPFSVHPLEIPVGGGKFRYYFGATVLNTTLILGLILLHLAVALWCFLVIGGSETRPFPNSLSFVKFPSMSVSPFVLFYQPTLTSAFKVVWNGSQDVERGERAVAGVVLLIGLLFVIFVGFILHPRNFKAEAKTESGTLWLNAWLRGPAQYEDSSTVNHGGYCAKFGALFKDYKPSRYYFFTAEIVFAFVLAVVNSPSLSNLDRCKTGQATIGFLFLLYAVIIIAFDPLQARLVRILFYTSAVADLVAVVSSFLDLGFGFQILAMAAITVSSLCLVGIGVVNLLVVLLFDTQRFRDWLKHRTEKKRTAKGQSQVPPLKSDSDAQPQETHLLSEDQSGSESDEASDQRTEEELKVTDDERVSGRWNKGYRPHTFHLSSQPEVDQKLFSMTLNNPLSSPSFGPRKVDLARRKPKSSAERVTTLPIYKYAEGISHTSETNDDAQRQLAMERELQIKKIEDKALELKNSKEGRVPTARNELELWNML